MFDKNSLENFRKATELQLDGLRKIAEAQKMLEGCNQEAAITVQGDPQPAVVQETGAQEPMILMLEENTKMASLSILNKVAQELSASDNEEDLRVALELDKIARDIEKNAFVYEQGTPNKPTKESFQSGVLSVDPADKSKDLFNEDVTHQVADMAKNPLPYQKR